MSHSTKPSFELEGASLIASALHAQLLARRRATFEHDLKNIIHGLMSGTELLNRTLATDTPRVTPAECVALLQQQLGRTRETLQRLLDEVAPRPTPPSAITLSVLIEECLQDMRHDLQRVAVTSALQTDIRVHASRTLLKDVLLYLLLDPSETPQRRTTLKLTSRSDGDFALLELHYPLADSTHRPPSIEVVADVLRNANAIIDFTVHEEMALVTLRMPLAPAPSNAGVLIVAANRDAADSLAMLAQLEGWEARAAYDIDAALNVARAHSPRAILVDIDGVLDGAALITRARKELSHPPRLIAMSHDDTSQDTDFDARLRKPLDMKALRAALSDE